MTSIHSITVIYSYISYTFRSMFKQIEFRCFSTLLKNRIVDNMPITWCYEVADSVKKYCSTGFPIGCAVTEAGQPKDACVINVSVLILIFFVVVIESFI